MPEPFKNLFNKEYFENFTEIAGNYIPSFDKKKFIDQIFDDNWDERALKERARHTSTVLHTHLSGNYKEDVELIFRIIDHISESPSLKPGIEAMFFADYLECFGLDHYDISIHAMERMTCFFSCEFAIRPYIIRYPQRTLSRMLQWSQNPHEQIRRLSSEGCRPRLPWGIAIPFLKKDPSPIIPILENLKNDESETVQRSVANNLNDISKDHPERVLALVREWKGKSKITDWIVKHGSRTLLKQGHPEAMALFGFLRADHIQISDFQIARKEIRIGEELEFTAVITNHEIKECNIRLEYAIGFLLSNNRYGQKVFKISESIYKAGMERKIVRKHSFRPISTRRYYAGIHQIRLIVNGVEKPPLEFILRD